MSRGSAARLRQPGARRADSIPPGRVMSYGDVAEYLGQGGPRQVGRVMALWGGSAPWWRVVHADGSLVPGHERAALERYRAEGTPLRPSPRRAAVPRGHAPGPLGRRGNVAGPGGERSERARERSRARAASREERSRARAAARRGTWPAEDSPGHSARRRTNRPRHPVNLTADVGALCWNAGRWTITRTPTGCCAGPRRRPIRRAWTPPSGPWWRTRAARCSCWPDRAPARPPPSSRRWCSGSPSAGSTRNGCWS